MSPWGGTNHMSAKEYQEMLRRKKAAKYLNEKVYVYEDGFVPVSRGRVTRSTTAAKNTPAAGSFSC